MKWITELLSILLLVQGIGGLISTLRDAGDSWFVQLNLLPDGLHIPASVALILLGLLLWGQEAKRKRSVTR